MIHNNLSVLLAERNIKITRVAKDTGISRSTITAIA
ncbi:helix-turn-helix transcriptional regulator, partial [Listeria monocytogenes]|nr:helix-turn-helix transcriptional regulator [Listeria monocytogenes]